MKARGILPANYSLQTTHNTNCIVPDNGEANTVTAAQVCKRSIITSVAPVNTGPAIVAPVPNEVKIDCNKCVSPSIVPEELVVQKHSVRDVYATASRTIDYMVYFCLADCNTLMNEPIIVAAFTKDAKDNPDTLSVKDAFAKDVKDNPIVYGYCT